MRRFAFDTKDGAAAIAEYAPGSAVECRIAPPFPSSVTPFGHKFGCAPAEAVDLLDHARALGLRPEGVCFHVGSQQLDPGGMEARNTLCRNDFRRTRRPDHHQRRRRLPRRLYDRCAGSGLVAESMMTALERHFGSHSPQLVVEPGRAIVGSAGTDSLRGGIGAHRHRRPALGVSRHRSLRRAAETENEYIRYRLRTDRDGDPVDDAVIAGPTCDGDDVLYQSYPLPVTLRAGDRVEIADAGAYTASYASASFNGFAPLPTISRTPPASDIVEPLAPGLTRTWRLSEVICDVRTEFQHLVIGRTDQGVALFSDGERQSTELSQLVYHEALLVPALLLADKIERVLVIGSGEGVVSQLAVAAGATQVDHVDIDRKAVRLCAEHLPYGYTMDELLPRKGDSARSPCITATAGPSQRIRRILRCRRRRPSRRADRARAAEPVVQRRLPQNLPRSGSRRGIPSRVPARGGTNPCASWRRFHESFEEVVYFGSDEHEWSFLSGLAQGAVDPVAAMSARLAALSYQPQTIDVDSLRASTIPPKALRESRPPPRFPARTATPPP